MELANRARQRKRRARELKQRPPQKNAVSGYFARKHRPVVARQIKQVNTPWGWPQHADQGMHVPSNHEVSSSLRHFADRLIDSKKTKEDRDYLEKRNASLRALLEDRYGRASRMTEVQYECVKAPRLRDPNEQFDQLDDFPSARADTVLSSLRGRTDSAVEIKVPVKSAVKATDLTRVKTPWGW